MARNFRELFRWLLPSWLTEGEGGLVAFSLATMKDAYLERVYQGLVARFPSYSAGDALAEISRERGLKQGYLESHESFVSRLQQWRTPKTHRVRGTAFEALRQAQITLGPGPFGMTYVSTIDSQGNKHTRDELEIESYEYDFPWDWDTGTHARFWLEVRYLSGAAFNTYTTTSDLWTREDGNETVGIDGVNPRRLSDVRDLFAQAPQWKPAGTRAMHMIIDPSDPGDPPLPIAPDPSWIRWSKIVGGVAVKARSPDLRYVALSPELYPGDASLFALSVTLPTGAVYGGNPANAAAWGAVPIPGVPLAYAGRTDFPYFARDPANPRGVHISDDGDLPPHVV